MRSSPRAGLALALLISTVAFGQSSGAQRYIDAAALLYQNLENERALDQLKKARTASGGVDDDVAIALYEGVILSDMGKKEDAIAAFREGLSLKPEAVLPVKVAPKIAEIFNTTKAEVMKQLAPIIAKRKAEEEARRVAAEKALKEEEAKRAAQAAEAERLRIEAEKLEAARRAAVNDAERKKLEAEKAELEKKVAELAAQRRQAEEDAKRRAAEEARRQAALAKNDRPEQTTLVPKTPVETKPEIVAPVAKPVPVAPFVLGGFTVAAGVVAGVFGYLASTEITAARAANFQSDTVAHLNQANNHALVSNIAAGTAGAMGIATLISIFASREPPPPPPVTQESP